MSNQICPSVQLFLLDEKTAKQGKEHNAYLKGKCDVGGESVSPADSDLQGWSQGLDKVKRLAHTLDDIVNISTVSECRLQSFTEKLLCDCCR